MKTFVLFATTMREFISNPSEAAWEPVCEDRLSEQAAYDTRVQLMDANPHLYIKMIEVPPTRRATV